jgi:hypothetical protein
MTFRLVVVANTATNNPPPYAIEYEELPSKELPLFLHTFPASSTFVGDKLSIVSIVEAASDPFLLMMFVPVQSDMRVVSNVVIPTEGSGMFAWLLGVIRIL